MRLGDDLLDVRGSRSYRVRKIVISSHKGFFGHKLSADTSFLEDSSTVVEYVTHGVGLMTFVIWKTLKY